MRHLLLDVFICCFGLVLDHDMATHASRLELVRNSDFTVSIESATTADIHVAQMQCMTNLRNVPRSYTHRVYCCMQLLKNPVYQQVLIMQGYRFL